MTEHSSASIRPPKDWQDFERNSRILFECILNDINTQRNGRTGQPQHGVDVFGRKDGQGAWYGIQCKGKDVGLEGKVTEKELREEVEKSEKFSPKITHFILVTTAPDDAVIQEVAREITDEKEKNGTPLNVAVWGWSSLEERIAEHPKALQAFEPDSTPHSNKIIENTDYTKVKVDEVADNLAAFISSTKKSGLHIEVNETVEEDESGVNGQVHAEIDGYRSLINNQQPRTALKLLEGLKDRLWPTASDRIKFRIETNIGSAKLYLSKEKEIEGAGHFFEAARYEPDDPKARANLVLAHLIKKEIPDAIRVGKEALELQEGNDEAASYLIQAYIYDTEVEDPLTLIPEAVKGSASVDLAITNFYRSRNDDRWVETALNSLGRHADKDRIIQFACDAVLEKALVLDGLLNGQTPDQDIDFGALYDASGKMQKLWEKQLNGETPSIDASLPHNLVQLYRVLNKYDLAKEVTFQAIEIMPKELVIAKLAANFYRDEGNDAKAEKVLGEFVDDPEARLFLAEIKYGSDPKGLIEDLEGIEKYELTDRQRIIIGGLRVDAFLACSDKEESERLRGAEAEYETLATSFPNNILVSQIHSVLLEAKNEVEKMHQVLECAEKLVDNGAGFYERYILAKRFDELGQYSHTANLLLGHVDLKHDSPPLRTLYFSLINSDRRLQAYKLLQEIPDEIASDPSFLGATINLHFRRGDYDSAEQAINRLIELKPNDLRTHLSRLDVWLRKNDDGAIASFFNQPVENMVGNTSEYLRLAALLGRFGQAGRALKLAYRMLLSEPANPDIQLAFMELILLPPAEKNIDLSVDHVGIDAAFTIRNSENQKEIYLIEDCEDLRITEEAIPSGHYIALAANEKVVGEKITFPDGEEWELVEVKHKYIYQLHRNMERFNRRFPENTQFQRFTMVGEEESSLDPILNQIKDKHDATNRTFDVYEKSPLPLVCFSKYLGGNVIDSWAGLVQSERSFNVCHGLEQERDAAKENIEKNGQKGCVTDALTLYIIKVLDILDVVERVCGKIAVTETTIDVFRYRLEHIKSRGNRPFTTMFWQDGEYFKDEISAERLSEAVQYREEELNWILQNVEIVPAESQALLSEEAVKIRTAISFDFLDPFIAAQGQDKLFICEDQAYRKYAIDEFDLSAAWLQPILLHALENELISKKMYSKAICRIASFGHNFTSLDAIDLECSLDHDDVDFQLVAKALFGTQAELKSHVRVMLATLNKIWCQHTDPPLRLQRATSILLRRLFFGEWKRVYSEVGVSDIKGIVNSLERNGNFKSYFNGWLKGHFIII